MSSRRAFSSGIARGTSLTDRFRRPLASLGCVAVGLFGVAAATDTATAASVATPAPSASPASPVDGAGAVLDHSDVPGVFERVSSEVGAVFAKCKGAVVRIIATDDYGVHCGTGFFVDPNGTIYSHYSVAGRSWNLIAEFEDKKYPATCLLADPRSGVALLKIQAAPTPFLPIASGPALQPAAPVIIVGYPMDMAAAPNFGMVAGLNQKYLWRYLPTTHIRANVQVQSGEQGAPMLNVKGEVVGIVAFSGREGEGCYALPIQAAEKVRGDYTRFGEVKYGWIGVNVEPVIESDENCEVKIAHMEEETPAWHSGLKNGDVLVSVGNRAIKKFADLRDASFFLSAEDMVPITVKRGDEIVKVEVRAGSPPGKVSTAAVSPNENGTKLSLPGTP